jgi:hypothetical protein
MTDVYRSGKDLEGNCRDITGELERKLSRKTEENHDKYRIGNDLEGNSRDLT